jgi:hypothetical protein
MGFGERLQASVNYGEKVLNSGLEGARAGREAFLNGKPLTPFLGESVQNAWKPAAIGACIGLLSSCSVNGHKSIRKVVTYGFLGGVIGFGAGVVWGSRHLVASVAAGARKNMGKVRDEHWLDEHPIDYA